MLVFVLINGQKDILGVVQDQALAERWYDAAAENDYISFELDNLNLTGLEVSPLQPPSNADEVHSKIRQGLDDAKAVQRHLEEIRDQVRKKRGKHIHKIKPKGEKFFCSTCKGEFQPCTCMNDGQPSQYCRLCTGLGWAKKAGLLKGHNDSLLQ